MRLRNFESELWLPRPREEVFAFFADATNLDLLTPDWLQFHTITPQPIAMRAGTLIDYQLRLRGIPIRWRTEIKVWEPPTRFVDEQIRGPYRLWIHEHTFAERDGGTLVRDRVRYAVPFDFLAHKFLVRPDVERIFAFHTQVLQERFSGQAR
ncbi:MAG: SRPBCC family protein [Verrucomicrobiota bacterium]|nr:SRPBCC family protein [Verrucomicrobiota bacterium]